MPIGIQIKGLRRNDDAMKTFAGIINQIGQCIKKAPTIVEALTISTKD